MSKTNVEKKRRSKNHALFVMKEGCKNRNHFPQIKQRKEKNDL